ncbi:MAG: hypothetical protein ACRD3J_07980 [Thermoanaerobaculia bacterium]
MVRWVVERRVMASAATAAAISIGCWREFPWSDTDPVLRLIAFHQPALYSGLHLTYALLLFSTPYLGCSVVLSLADIFFVGERPASHALRLPPYPDPQARAELFLVLGERHHPTKRQPSVAPYWLTIPDRGLFTGIAIIGAVGSGKTSGCMYPFAHQLFGYRANDPGRRIGGLVLEVKGDFCHQVRRILAAHGREDDYVEVGLEGSWRYNPLHNELDAYALAYGIASLLNNVFGKGKEPFWQQAYTNLVKFIILLHKVMNDYVTLFEVYECAINPDLLAERIADERRLQHARGK